MGTKFSLNWVEDFENGSMKVEAVHSEGSVGNWEIVGREVKLTFEIKTAVPNVWKVWKELDHIERFSVFYGVKQKLSDFIAGKKELGDKIAGLKEAWETFYIKREVSAGKNKALMNKNAAVNTLAGLLAGLTGLDFVLATEKAKSEEMAESIKALMYNPEASGAIVATLTSKK